MSLTVTLELPADVEERLRRQSSNLDLDVKIAYTLDLFRRGEISHAELSSVLGLDRFQTDAFLKSRKIFEGSPTFEDIEADQETLKQLLNKQR